MAKAKVTEESRYSIQLDDLTFHQLHYLMGVFQNSPMDYNNPNDEPSYESDLRRAIFTACKDVLGNQ